MILLHPHFINPEIPEKTPGSYSSEYLAVETCIIGLKARMEGGLKQMAWGGCFSLFP